MDKNPTILGKKILFYSADKPVIYYAYLIIWKISIFNSNVPKVFHLLPNVFKIVLIVCYKHKTCCIIVLLVVIVLYESNRKEYLQVKE